MLYIEYFDTSDHNAPQKRAELLTALTISCSSASLPEACELLRSTLLQESWCVFVRGDKLTVYSNLGVSEPAPHLVATLRAATLAGTTSTLPPSIVAHAADLRRRGTVIVVPADFRHYDFLLVAAVNRFRPCNVVCLGVPSRDLMTKMMAPGRKISVVGLPEELPDLAIRIDASWEHEIVSAARGIHTVPEWYRHPQPAPMANAQPFHAALDFRERYAAMR